MKVIAERSLDGEHLSNPALLPLLILGYQNLTKFLSKKTWLYQNSLNQFKSESMENYLKEQCTHLLQTLGIDPSYSRFSQFEHRTNVHLKTEYLLMSIENTIETAKNYSIEGRVISEAVQKLEEDINHFFKIQLLLNHSQQEQKINHEKENIKQALEKLIVVLKTETESDRPTPKIIRLLKDIKAKVDFINHIISKTQESELYNLTS
ncbi:MAG: hypothetical protein KDD50_10310 [Bdellovibrionales bacterium]|nr:hypothetical protein [Bdellovibrionales bacterium]